MWIETNHTYKDAVNNCLTKANKVRCCSGAIPVYNNVPVRWGVK